MDGSVERRTLEVGASPMVEIRSVGGSLRLVAQEGTQLEIQAPSRGGLHVEQDGGQISISCRSDCVLFLPRSAGVQVGSVGGDLRALGLQGEVSIGTVGGDADLRRLGPLRMERLGGDLRARKLRADLVAPWIGGDARIEGVQGDVRLESVGGDLLVQDALGDVVASAGGDVSLRLHPPAEATVEVRAGGDLICRLSPDAGARVTARAGGNLDLPEEAEVEHTDEGIVAQVGEDGAVLRLTAGGNLVIGLADADSGAFWGTDGFSARIAADLEGLDTAFAGGAFTFDGVKMAENIRLAVQRALSRSPRVRGRRRARKSASQTADDERLRVLRMLERGKITLEQAEKLLEALEAEA